jgi:hypothetical protein
MPYLSFDLDALNDLPDMERASGITEAQLALGLLRMWRYAWQRKTDRIEALHLGSFFGGNGTQVCDTLRAFGFVEPVGEGVFRVKGAERYLRITKARSDAGKTRTATAKRDNNGKLAAGDLLVTQPANAGDPASNSPANAGDATSNGLALTSSIEHRASNLKPPPPRAREASPYVPLIDRVSDTFRQARGANFKATFADEQAVSELLRKSDGNEDEIVRRFAIGLRRTRFPECHDLVGLAKYWNAYVKAEEPRATSPPRRHEPQTVAKDWANEKEGEVDL